VPGRGDDRIDRRSAARRFGERLFLHHV
jgi:hypothetical protein